MSHARRKTTSGMVYVWSFWHAPNAFIFFGRTNVQRLCSDNCQIEIGILHKARDVQKHPGPRLANEVHVLPVRFIR